MRGGPAPGRRLQAWAWPRPPAPLPVLALLLLAALPARADLALRGGSGGIEMPSAFLLPDGTLASTLSHFGGLSRTALTFQISPRLQASFRYSSFKIPANGLGIDRYGPGSRYFDRAFDLRYQLLAQGGWWPSVVVGLQDFAGTGVEGGEYLVAGRQFGAGFRVNLGLGWGSLGSRAPLLSTGGRPAPPPGSQGGTLNLRQWFRGDAALFGGVEWQAGERLHLKAEWSSDRYSEYAGRQRLFDPGNGLNLGVEYQLNPAVRLGAYSLGGREIGFAAQIALNLRQRGAAGFGGKAPRPVALRAAGARHSPWPEGGGPVAMRTVSPALIAQLSEDGLVPERLELSAGRAGLYFRNPRLDSPTRAFGRAARALAASLPPSVEVLDLVLVSRGMPVSRLRLRRSDLESLELQFDAAARLAARVEVLEADPPDPAAFPLAAGSRFSWQLSPFLRPVYFDPEKPLRLDAGLRLRGEWHIAQGLYFGGAYAHRLAGNLKDFNHISNSVLPHVRTDDYLRDRRAGRLEELKLSWYAKPGPALYSRMSLGLLEAGYGGVSGELLWKPVASRLALGVELNALRQRALQRITGFESYKVLSGHVSAYYEPGGGYLMRLDLGRYLAKDLGGTLTLEREFANGWRVGAFATLTNVSHRDFGEGSFDKGIRLTIPLGAIAGSDRRQRTTETIRLVQRDGGAQLQQSGRLYELVREGHQQRLSSHWGQIWR